MASGVYSQRQARPETPPALNEVVRLVAMLGGFLGRKGDGEPGVKTLEQGLQHVMDFTAGLKCMRDKHYRFVCNGTD